MLINPGTTSKLCACHLLVPDQCPFWSEVQRQVIDSVGVPLDGLALMEDGDDKTFSLHNQALFMAIASVSGCSIIVDSSKSLIRLSRLLQAKSNGCCIDVKPLHLHRGPLGLVNSARKKGHALFPAAAKYSREFFRTRDLLKNYPYMFVSYEMLARRTQYSLRRVMRWIGLSVDASQLQWREGIRRDIGGNRMRRGSSSVIKVDQSWRQDLSCSEVLKLTLFTLPIRLRWKWLYRKFHDRKMKFGL